MLFVYMVLSFSEQLENFSTTVFIVYCSLLDMEKICSLHALDLRI